MTARDAALHYLSEGLCVIPLKPQSKEPALKSWKEFQHRKPTHEELAAAFPDGEPRNVAVVTGKVSGVVVLDVDKPDALGLAMPITPTVKTSRGRHYYFRYPEGGVKSSVLPVGELQSDGKLVTAPPSVHEDGTEYKWEVGLDVALADLPSELIPAPGQELVVVEPAQVVGNSRSWFRAVESFENRPEGDRHQHLLRLVRAGGGLCASGGLDEEEARAALIVACRRNGLWDDPRYGAAKVKGTIRDGWNYGLQQPIPLGPSWPVVSRYGNPAHGHPSNIRYFFDYKTYRLRWNDFTNEVELDEQRLDDGRLTDIWSEGREMGLIDEKGIFADLVIAQARENRYHPVREYLKNLEWDKTPRIKHWLYRHCGAEKSDITCWFGAATFMGAVHRVMDPGCKFDLMLVLEGPQGAGKSLLAAELGGDWFGDGVRLGDEPKLMIEQTAGKWIIEVPELTGMSNKEVEHVKAQLSRTHDRARLAYARLPSDIPRQFVLIGTTNDDKYLKDRSGNRRFMPVKVGKIDLEVLKAERDQLWAEAYWRYQQKMPANPIPEMLWKDAGEAQAARVLEDPVEDYLIEWLGERTGVVEKDAIRTALTVKGFRPSQAMDNNVTRIMEKLGWRSSRQRRGKDRNPRVYSKGEGGWLDWDGVSAFSGGRIRLDLFREVA